MKAKRSALRLATHIEFGLLFFADGGEDRATRVNVGMRDHLATKGHGLSNVTFRSGADI